ncbi:MAG: thioredoxin-dependent peroxiredoxin [Chloroflexota bacterium]|jgi:peroxiredoxin Q/BCP|nr:thioredoxin-dependent peroxiredoxin [Chloroflexota bacterium]
MTDIDASPPMPEVGEPAPDFTLPDDTGAPRQLSDQRGHWLVLYFYPEDDTAGCTTEACQFRDADAAYRELDATIWGVSGKTSAAKAAFKAKFGLPFTLLADEDHGVSERYGTWVLKNNYGKTSWGIKRSTLVIDPEGRVAKVWPRVKADGHADEVLATLRELKAAGLAA